MIRQDIVVIGGSAGSLEPLRTVVSGLRDYQGSVLVVMHMSPDYPSVLPRILSQHGTRDARRATDGVEPRPGVIYVAVPNRHMIIERGRIRLTYGPRENRARPAIDALFRTAAAWYGERVIGVVLSGMLDDGTVGLARIKAAGGAAIVQEPREAQFSSMPFSAIEHVRVDDVLPSSKIAPMLIARAGADEALGELSSPRPTAKDRPMSDDAHADHDIPESDLADDRLEGREPTVLSCPTCNGVLLRNRDERLLHFVCHTGHSFSPMSLAREERDALERNVESAHRAVKERAVLTLLVAEQARKAGDGARADVLEAQARLFEQAADETRRLAERLQKAEERPDEGGEGSQIGDLSQG